MEQKPRFYLTEELAAAVRCSPQTVRKVYCMTGEFHGVRPRKMGNRLLWPREQVEKLLTGEVVNADRA